VFRLAGHFGQPEREVTRHPVEWFFDRWDRLQRLKYQELVGRVSAVQAGTSRSLALAFNKKRKSLPSLPTYEEARGRAEDRALERTDPKAGFWWLRPPERGEGEGGATGIE
jgi:hypothetical protein